MKFLRLYKKMVGYKEYGDRCGGAGTRGWFAPDPTFCKEDVLKSALTTIITRR